MWRCWALNRCHQRKQPELRIWINNAGGGWQWWNKLKVEMIFTYNHIHIYIYLHVYDMFVFFNRGRSIDKFWNKRPHILFWPTGVFLGRSVGIKGLPTWCWSWSLKSRNYDYRYMGWWEFHRAVDGNNVHVSGFFRKSVVVFFPLLHEHAIARRYQGYLISIMHVVFIWSGETFYFNGQSWHVRNIVNCHRESLQKNVK